VQIAGIAVVAAVLVGVPLGILITRQRWLEGVIIKTAGVLYTVPSLALFAVLIPFTGLGVKPVIIALVLYSLLTIIRNTVAGIESVDRAALDAARGLGMTGAERLFLVELPIGLPVILAGIRVASVAAIGTTTIAAYVGAGGLGRLIFDGIRTLDADRVLAGALATSALAIVTDTVLATLAGQRRGEAVPAAGTA
jgi:osmoprotectant transport system permease protein